MAVELGSEHSCCNPTRQFLYLHWCPNVECDERPFRRADFEQFGYTDKWPGCANARAGRKQAVEHSEQCRSCMEAILVTTTEGHMPLERARERFAQFAEELGVVESQRKRHRPEGEGRQPPAPPASTAVEPGVRSNYQEGGRSSSGSALPASDSPQPPQLEKPGLEQETEMTDAPPEAEGLVMPDLTTTWDSDCRTRCRNMENNSTPLLLIDCITKLQSSWCEQRQRRLWWRRQGASTGGSAFGIHLSAARNTGAHWTVLPSHTFTFCRQLGSASNSGLHEQVPRHFPDSD